MILLGLSDEQACYTTTVFTGILIDMVRLNSFAVEKGFCCTYVSFDVSASSFVLKKESEE